MYLIDTIKSNKKQVLWLNAIALAVYFLAYYLIGFDLSEKTMFGSTDSKGYLNVANWIFNGEDTIYTEKRPLLYPLIIGLPYQLFGVVGIWIIQLNCWLIAINFTFFGAKKWTENNLVAWISVSIIMLNLSLIALTFQAITELVTTVLLSYLFYFIVSNRHQRKTTYFIHGILLILIALTLVKPLFYFLTLLCLLILPIFYFKQYLKRPKSLLSLGLVLAPLLFQMTLMKVKHDVFKVSVIGSETFTNYYFSKCVRDIEHLGIPESIEFSNRMSTKEQRAYMCAHKGMFVFQFFENIEFNIKAEPIYFKNHSSEKQPVAYDFMSAYNNVSFLIHLLGLLVMLVSIIRTWRKKKYDQLIPILFIGGLSTYFIITSGLSFWQGDRLVLPSLVLWVPLYSALIFFSLKRWRVEENEISGQESI